MIPQIQEQLAKLEAAYSEIRAALDDTRRDLAQLREQLQVGRAPEANCVTGALGQQLPQMPKRAY